MPLLTHKMFAMFLSGGAKAGAAGGGGVNAIGAGLHRAAATQSIPNNATTLISWDTKDFDTSGFLVGGTLPATTLTVPFTGLYLATASILWTPTASLLNMTFVKNGTVNFGTSCCPTNAGGSTDTGISLSYLFSATAGDTIGVGAFQASGAAVNVVGAAELTSFGLLGFH